MFSVKQELLAALGSALEQVSPGAGARAAFETPKVAAHGDLACTAAMQLAKPLKLNPRQLGEQLRTALLAQPALADVIGPIRRPTRDFASDEEVMAHIRATAATAYHPSSTCRMGADPASVVDGDLCVRGIEGLRVADASIFPRLPGGNTNLPVIMVAERASDFIRKTHG